MSWPGREGKPGPFWEIPFYENNNNNNFLKLEPKLENGAPEKPSQDTDNQAFPGWFESCLNETGANVGRGRKKKKEYFMAQEIECG